MKKFVAIYIGTEESLERNRWNELAESERQRRVDAGMKAWMDWGKRHAAAIVDQGAPLGKTKRIASEGISNIRNQLTGYVIVQAQSHEAAAQMFEDHPHFAIFPGDSVQIMECLPLPGR